jgi:DNA-directed RNA polymerase specialized sigma subunit
MSRELSEFTRFITLKAQSYAYQRSDVDDFIQEGMIAAWQAIERDPEAYDSYVKKAIEWRMIDYARKIYSRREVGYTSTHENLLYGNYGDGEEST